MSKEEKTEKVLIGRPVEFENVVYGKGEYMVTPRVAAALRARNATASVAAHMATEKERERQREAEEARAAGGGVEGGGDPSKTGVVIGGGSAPVPPDQSRASGEGSAPGGGGTFNQSSGEPPTGGTSDANSLDAAGGAGFQSLARDPADVTRERAAADAGGVPHGGGGGESAASALGSGVESLKGELPADFPARDKLAKGNPDKGIQPVTRYEQLTPLTRDQLDLIPGIAERSIEQIGQRLFAEAEKMKNAGGGGGQ